MEITRLDSVQDAADLDAVTTIEAASFANPWSREKLEGELREPTAARLYVLRLPEAGIAAFCSCWVLADELHVNTMAVDLRLRRRGLGRALMQHVLSETEQEGVRRATLEVRRSNVGALRLYESIGFATVAVRPRYYTNPEEDALILWREPSP